MQRGGILRALIGLFGYIAACAAQQSSDHSVPVDYQGTINQYCVGCHNDTQRTAGLSLQGVNANDVGPGAEVWEKVLRKLKVRSMPPAGMPRPDRATYESFAAYLESSLDKYGAEHPQPAFASLRRLNRTEYFNAVRELLAVEINDDTLLPPDDTMYGFDNVGAVLTLSPLLAEQYIVAARTIRRLALGQADMPPDMVTYNVPRYLMQDDWLGESMPLGTRGGMSVKHHFPMDGEYIVRIRLQRNSRDYIRGLLNGAHQIDLRIDGVRVSQLSIGGEKLGKSGGIYSTSAQGVPEQEQYERFADEALEVRFEAKAGTRELTVVFVDQTLVPEQPLYTEHSIIDYAQYKAGVPGVSTVIVEGPFNPTLSTDSPSHQRVYVCKPKRRDDPACAKKILSTLGQRAYRRPLTTDELNGLLTFYKQGQEQGGFDEGIGLALERILAGPKFIFISEQIPEKLGAGVVYQLSDTDLATRLALFLWSSIPDDELLKVAASGRLHKPEVLKKQVERMLNDPRSVALIQNFASQWLNLNRLATAAPNGEQFPYFDDNLRLAFSKETELFFDYVMRNNRPLLELLDANYTFINERLARHYAIPGVYGSHFRRVMLPDRTRGGLLGQGSILTVTSYANRTAPTIRGKWVLQNILSAPPPPPPPNVPGLRDKNDEGKVLTMREQMEQHRANPVCASCHKVMDPLGFALENYDATGRWRTVDAKSGSPIDSTGTLPDGTPFEGPDQLRTVLVEQRNYDFVMTAIEKLLTYALGRGLVHTDAPAMRDIMRRTEADKHSLSSLILNVVESQPFQTRRVPDHADN
jgi:mono/diheme cytochrome c family protein